MLNNYIGDKAFSEGLHQYLSSLAYKNAVTEQLWASLEKVRSNKYIRYTFNERFTIKK